MAAFWAVFTFGGSGPALTAHGSLDLKQEIQIQIQIDCATGSGKKICKRCFQREIRQNLHLTFHHCCCLLEGSPASLLFGGFAVYMVSD
jgi:hypothetical protein